MKTFTLLVRNLLLPIVFLSFMGVPAFADIVITSGATMQVSASTDVVVTTNLEVESGGTLTVLTGGNLELTGDLTNSGTASLGDGDILLNGSALQTIGGSTTSEFGGLEIDNSSGVDLAVDATVNGTLTLTDGILDISTYNLGFGAAANAVAGSPAASNMIQADGTGQVRKFFSDGTSDPGTFVFTIGSAGEYSPIELDFNTSTFASAYVGVNVTASKEPDNSSIDSYLERYWSIETSGITAYTYNLTATYVEADFVGTEADISGAVYDGADWWIVDPVNTTNNTFSGNNLDADGNATGVEFRILSDLKIFCEGAYVEASDEMTTVLNSDIPLTAAEAYNHIGYTGTESVAAIPSADIVDWILIEVRDAASAAGATTPGDTVAGFLMKDGTIVSTDGASPLKFKTLISNNAYFVMIHRNHLAVMTANSPAESFGNYSYDFTDASNKAYGTDAQLQLDSSPVVYGMYAGETNLSGIISHADKQAIDDTIDSTGYQLADTNFSAIVTHADKQYIDDNINQVGQVP